MRNNKCDKKKFKSFNEFNSTNKQLEQQMGGTRKNRKKSRRNYRISQHIRIINGFFFYFFLVSAVSILALAGSHSPPHPPGCPPTLHLSLDLFGGSSDSNLVLLLCILASNVHSCQNYCISFVRTLNVLSYIP